MKTMIPKRYIRPNVNLDIHKDLLSILPDILDALVVKGFKPVIFEARRTVQEQREKVRKGYSQTMNSKHVVGKAVDIIDRRYAWNDKRYAKQLDNYWEALREITSKYPQIKWGGYWKSFGKWGDFAHIELR